MCVGYDILVAHVLQWKVNSKLVRSMTKWRQTSTGQTKVAAIIDIWANVEIQGQPDGMRRNKRFFVNFEEIAARGFLRTYNFRQRRNIIKLLNQEYKRVVPRSSLLLFLPRKADSCNTRIGPEQPPTFELPELCDNSFDSKKLLTDQQTFLETLQVTREESCQYESDTRNQSKCPTWHTLRKYLITVSKRVTGRQDRFDKLAK